MLLRLPHFNRSCRASSFVVRREGWLRGYSSHFHPLTRVPKEARATSRGVLECYTKPMLDWSSCPAVERTPDKVSGAWVFRGTRIPVKALFENLEDGASVDDFLEWFPGVTKDQVDAVLEHASSLA
jgi:uncharacterized protein (DUF433 family)